MSIGRTLRTLFLGITIGTAWPYFSHYDAYQIPRGERLTGFFRDPGWIGSTIYSEHALEMEFFRFLLVAFITFLLFAVHWSRKHPAAPHNGGLLM